MGERLTDQELDDWERIVRESTGTAFSEPFGLTALSVIRELRERRAVAESGRRLARAAAQGRGPITPTTMRNTADFIANSPLGEDEPRPDAARAGGAEEEWDLQIEEDARAGRLGKLVELAAKARIDHEAGRTTPLTPESLDDRLGRAAHSAWKLWIVGQGYADHAFDWDLTRRLEGPVCTCGELPDAHHADMVPWSDLPEAKRGKYVELARAGYLIGLGLALGRAEGGV